MTRLLGVDGGGTKTMARLFEAGPSGRLCLIASGTAGGSNPHSVGWEACQAAISQAIRVATGGSAEGIEAATIAVAGCAAEASRERLESWAQGQAIAQTVEVVPDTQPILADLPAGEEGIGLIAGTGSSGLALHASGKAELVGGWGYLVDDGGSGFALGRDALRQIFHDADARATPSELTTALLNRTGFETVAEIKAAIYGADDPRGWIASLAPAVIGLAEQDEPSAVAIVSTAADQLATLAENAANRLSGSRQTLPVCLAGGLLASSTFYRDALKTRLMQRGWPAEQVRLAPDGAVGCALLAQRLLKT